MKEIDIIDFICDSPDPTLTHYARYGEGEVLIFDRERWEQMVRYDDAGLIKLHNEAESTNLRVQSLQGKFSDSFPQTIRTIRRLVADSDRLQAKRINVIAEPSSPLILKP